MATPKQPGPGTGPTPHGAHILIVDDEQALRQVLGKLLRRMGYQVTEAASGPEALGLIAGQSFDLVILDLKMPEMDGTEVLEAARRIAPGTVYIILTAYGTLNSAIAAIRHGAFDYLLKPSRVKEIIHAVEGGLTERQRRLRQDPVVVLEQALASVKTAPRPSEPTPERFLRASEVTIDTDRRLVVVGGRRVDLTPAEFDILTYLVRHRDRVVSCRELAGHLRGWEVDERDARSLLRSHVHRLRRKLEADPARPRLIRTVRGNGYLVVAREDKVL